MTQNTKKNASNQQIRKTHSKSSQGDKFASSETGSRRGGGVTRPRQVVKRIAGASAIDLSGGAAPGAHPPPANTLHGGAPAPHISFILRPPDQSARPHVINKIVSERARGPGGRLRPPEDKEGAPPAEDTCAGAPFRVHGHSYRTRAFARCIVCIFRGCLICVFEYGCLELCSMFWIGVFFLLFENETL